MCVCVRVRAWLRVPVCSVYGEEEGGEEDEEGGGEGGEGGGGEVTCLCMCVSMCVRAIMYVRICASAYMYDLSRHVLASS